MNLQLSPEAAEHLKRDLNDSILRVAFTTGCGGSGYRLGYADAPNDGDQVMQLDGVQVALDDMSARRLDGAVIEYDEAEEGYVLDHPDAVNVAWCG